MQKFFLFFVKKLLTKFLSYSIISNVSGTRQNTKQYARVAQLVEHDLAKVGAAGSSPVSCSLKPLKNQGFLFFVLHFMLHFIKVLQSHVIILLGILFDCSPVNSF